MPNSEYPRTPVGEIIDAVVSSTSKTLLATDFDGTLALIVDDPDSAALLPGALQVVQNLSLKLGELAVISGRPLQFLADRFQVALGFPLADPISDLGPPTQQWPLSLVGLYGLEQYRHGVRSDHPQAAAWPRSVAQIAAAAERSGPAGMRVELKGLSITLHFRGQPNLAQQVEDYAQEVAQESGLVARSARMSVELHPPIEVDKGTVLSSYAASHNGPVLFLGDDVGDLPAFDACDRLAASGTQAFKILAHSKESDQELIDRADLILDGPPSVLRFLQQLQTAV
ncbi:MAG: trehalose-phosphatase [Microthrixaceae bacterium]